MQAHRRTDTDICDNKKQAVIEVLELSVNVIIAGTVTLFFFYFLNFFLWGEATVGFLSFHGGTRARTLLILKFSENKNKTLMKTNCKEEAEI